MQLLTAIKLTSVSTFCALVLAVPTTDGPIAAPAMAKKKCGGDGQRACTIFERPGKPCDTGLTQRARDNFDIGKCIRNYTIVPSSRGSRYRNPPPRYAEVLPIPNVRDDGRYNDHGGATAVKICNRSNTSTIYAAIAYYDWGIYGDKPNWSSAGWWSLRRGQCKEVGLIDDYEVDAPYAGQVYLMAVGGGLAWEGKAAGFCVNRGSEFRIKNADRARCTEENLLYGYEFTVTPGKLNFFDFDG